MHSPLTLKIIHGCKIEPYINDIAKLRITVFREFPYLYDGSLDYETSYLKTYTSSADSIAVLVLDGDQLVGVSTGLPMSDEEASFQRPFKEHGYDIDTFFYCGESILLPEYRGQGIYSRFFEEREKQAKSLGGVKSTTFCAVQRSADHPLRPDGYQPLDPVWKKFGYIKHPELTTKYSWKDVNESYQSEKKMVFWMKEIGD
jgi:GNAT superfamily N-acetyltransferase